MIDLNYSSVFVKQICFYVVEAEPLKWLLNNLQLHDCTFWEEPFRKGSLVTVDLSKCSDAAQDWISTFLKSPNFTEDLGVTECDEVQEDEQVNELFPDYPSYECFSSGDDDDDDEQQDVIEFTGEGLA